MRVVRDVTLETTTVLMRDFRRLVQVIGFERRALAKGEPWTQVGNTKWHRKLAISTLLTGNKKFKGLPESEKREIWAIFAGWDPANTGTADTREVAEAFATMGLMRDAPKAVDNLVRLVDFDNTGELSWMKFKAILGLATADRPFEETSDDVCKFFEFIDTNEDGTLSIFELGDGFERMKIGLSIDDVANLLFVHFGSARPNFSKEEFVQWVTET
mmetsp:Transcript_29498/g.66857  ORF Transcript_29498/g.66857 Transcript_29498/m.66857 type:complete len:215 (+) Transcript_29498:1-645(+)